MKQVLVNLYEYSDLDDKAKAKARDWYRNASMHDEWWERIYDDAHNAGLLIRGFDCDRGSSIDIAFTDTADATAWLIMENHGETCETWQTANKYLADARAVEAAHDLSEDADTVSELIDELATEFLRSLGEDYLAMLRAELELIYSDAYVDEAIEANAYTFTEDGARA